MTNVIRYVRTPLDLPLLLFIVSALIGVWASYDPATSWFKFALILAAVALYYALAVMRVAPRLLEIFVWIFLIGCAALAAYFVTQNDYAAAEGKFGPINQLGLFLNGAVPQLPFHHPHPNVVAGALEIALPLNVALIIQNSKFKFQNSTSQFTVYSSLFTCLLIAFGLLMTTSRGAWLALGVVAAGAVLLAVARNVLKRYALPIALIVALLGALAVMQMGDAFAPALENLLGAVPAGNTVVSRFTLFRQAWGLVQDYFFTGSGLGTFAMVFSTYALLIDVPFLTHAHNLFLEIWIEQGVLGLIAFVWLIVAFYGWVWRARGALNWLGLGAVAAATVMILHFGVDVLLYSSRALPLMFVPLGMAFASQQPTVNGEQLTVNSEQSGGIQKLEIENPTGALRSRKSKIGVASFIGLVTLFAVYCFLFAGNAAALWYANLGSVAQTRAELGQYRWPERLVEYTRREGGMPEAEAYFQQDLSFDPGNVTANQRLSEIALAQGNYTTAQENLERAYQRDPLNLVTWQLLGDAYLAQGRLDDAYALWSRVPDAKGKLNGEAWVRYEKNGDRARAGWAKELAGRIGK